MPLLEIAAVPLFPWLPGLPGFHSIPERDDEIVIIFN